jgi:cysteine desulfurase
MAGADADTAGRPAGLDAGTVYLDYNGTTPVDTRVIDALLPYLHTDFGNPSSSHSYGQAPRAAMDGARRDVARLIGAAADQIVFTGSGSEADALAIRGTVAAAADSGRSRPHLISQATEHPAVLAACRSVARDFDGRVTVLPVDERGLVRPGDLEAVLDDDTVLVSIMHANNETGVIQPIAELAALAHGRGASFHTDAAQSVGKIPVDVAALDVDLLTLVGHKMYAPKGVAALYVREPRRPLRPLVGGGGQERGRRAGTENVPYVVGLGTAARLAREELAAGQPARLSRLRDHLHRLLADALPGRVHVNGDTKNRLPHVLNVSIDGIAAHELLESCPTIAASTGSACHAGTHEPSPVLVAMGCSPERALAAIRLSLGRWSTFEDVVHAAVQITATAR